ncbi:MAG: hypothetical protein WDO13_09200 [Verrucomicrobiota bacterium]
MLGLAHEPQPEQEERLQRFVVDVGRLGDRRRRDRFVDADLRLDVGVDRLRELLGPIFLRDGIHLALQRERAVGVDDLDAGAQRLVGGEKKLHGFARGFRVALGGRLPGRIGWELHFVLHVLDALDLAGENFPERDERLAGGRAGEDGGAAIDGYAQTATLQKMPVEERELEQRLPRKGHILRRQGEAAEIDRRDADRGDALDESILGVEE